VWAHNLGLPDDLHELNWLHNTSGYGLRPSGGLAHGLRMMATGPSRRPLFWR